MPNEEEQGLALVDLIDNCEDAAQRINLRKRLWHMQNKKRVKKQKLEWNIRKPGKDRDEINRALFLLPNGPMPRGIYQPLYTHLVRFRMQFHSRSSRACKD